MATWDEIRNGIFAGESEGDYNALFGYSNRPGNHFANIRLTDMTVNDVLRFSDPSGPYANFVKSRVGRVATPMGAYQVVGTTLRDAVKGLGLTGNEKFDEATQDRIGQWIYQTQGTGAWEGYRGPQAGGAPMGLLSMSTSGRPDQPQTFGDRLRQSWKSGDMLDNITLALNSMRMRPDDNIGRTVALRQQERKAADARNRTAEVLAQISPEAAALVKEGLMSPSEALGVYRDQKAQDLAKQATDALARGDYQTAYALSLQISPTAAGQAIAQQFGPRQAEVTGGGMYTVTYENGVPKISVNKDVQQAEVERIRAETEARKAGETKQAPTPVIKAEEEDFAALDTIDQLNQNLDMVINDFGYDAKTGEFTGPLKDAFGASGWATGMLGTYTNFSGDASETARARERFERWKTSYVNDSLQLNKGVQTEGDAQRAASELTSAPTAAAAYKALQDLVRINQQARAIKERSIKGRRERYGLDPIEIPGAATPPDLGWRVVE